MTSTIFQLKRANQVQFSFASPSAVSPARTQQKLADITTALMDIVSSRKTFLPYDILYAYISDVCHDSETALKQLGEIVDRTLHTLAGLTKSGLVVEPTLARLHETYGRFDATLTLIRNILLPYDRTLHGESIRDSALRLFVEEVLGQHMDAVIGHFLALVDGLRQSTQESAVVRGVATLLRNCKRHELLQQALIASTQRYYEALALRLAQGSLVAYLQSVDEMFRREEQIAAYHFPAMLSVTVELAEKELVDTPLDALLDAKGTELRGLFEAHNAAAISLLVRLVLRVGREETLQAALISVMTAIGKVFFGEKDDRALVRRIIDFHAFVGTLVPLGGVVAAALKHAFEKFVNTPDNRVAVALVKHVDHLLKVGSVDKASADAVLHVFRFVTAKDIFEQHYQLLLSKRMLFRTKNLDAERVVIAALREECGNSYTAKLEEMLKDVELGMSAHAEVNALMQQHGLRADVGLTVINGTSWPACPAVKCLAMASELRRAQEVLEEWYVGKHQNRRLDFNPLLSVVVCRCPGWKGVEISMNIVQLEILLAATRGVTVKQVREMFETEDDIIDMQIKSFVLGKNVLLCSSTKDLSETAVLTLNASFQPTKPRIKVNNFQTKESKTEVERVDENVVKDRQNRVESTIVLLLKKQKSMTVNELMERLAERLAFPFESDEINDRLESLIGRDYLERDSEDPNKLNYLV